MAQTVAHLESVGVGASLTTLLDWLSIADFDDLIVFLRNAGGGSAGDITSVKIDVSNNGGDTVDSTTFTWSGGNLADGATGSVKSITGFTHLRIRAASASDTTADVTVVAVTAAAKICTLADVKDRLGETGTDYDTLIKQIIAAMGDRFDRYTQRQLIRPTVDLTEYYSGPGSCIHLRAYPVIEITSIKVSYDYTFSSESALTADSEYRLLSDGRSGVIFRNNLNWPDQPDCVQVIYRGGYVPAGQTPAAGETSMPNDLREAAILQASYIFKRRDDIGLTAVSYQGGSVSKFAAIKLLPEVEQTLDSYRRPIL